MCYRGSGVCCSGKKAGILGVALKIPKVKWGQDVLLKFPVSAGRYLNVLLGLRCTLCHMLQDMWGVLLLVDGIGGTFDRVIYDIMDMG